MTDLNENRERINAKMTMLIRVEIHYNLNLNHQREKLNLKKG